MKSRKANSSRPATKKRAIWLKAGIVAGALVVLGLTSGFTAMQFENHDNFCASCHSEPEATYFQREAVTSVDLASFHSTQQTNCIDCHSGQGLVPGRVSSLMLGAKDLLAWWSGHSTQPAVHTRPIEDANCLKCHAAVTQQQDFNNHFHAFLARWQAQDSKAATCVSCHQGHATDVEANLAFLNRASTTQVCQSCHTALRG